MKKRIFIPILLIILLTTACGSFSNPAPIPDCPGTEINRIGASIADEYEFVDYDQVMGWFCEGAEFQDILVALETEDQTGTEAAEMLEMLVDGFSWDEIWEEIGLLSGSE